MEKKLREITIIFGVFGEVGPQLNHLSSKTKMVNVLKVLQIRFQDHISEETNEEKYLSKCACQSKDIHPM